MAVVSGTIKNVFGHTQVLGPTGDSSGNPALCCYVSATFTGTYAQANDAQILAVDTAIQNSRRDGKTVTLLDACCAAPAVGGSAMGAKLTAVSGSDLTMTLTKTTLAAEHDDATGVINETPIAFCVFYKLS